VKRISIIFLCLVLIFIASGCSSIESPNSVMAKYLESIKKADIITATNYLSKSDNRTDPISNSDKTNDLMLKALFSKITYETPSLDRKENDKATVKVKVTAPDMTRIMGTVISQAFGMAFATAFSEGKDSKNTDTFMNQLIINSVNDPNCPMTTVEAQIEFIKEDNQWKILSSDENLTKLGDAITGNMITAFSGLASKFGSSK